MDTISKLVLRQMELEGEVDRIEATLKDAKERLRNVAEQLLPDAMDEAGVAKFETSDGYKVTLKDDITASVPKDRMDEVTAELERRKAGDLLTSEVSVSLPRGTTAGTIRMIMEAVASTGFNPVRKQGVNTATLKAWLRSQIAANVAVPLDLFGAHAFRKAVIKQ
jgi:hypothetical protein